MQTINIILLCFCIIDILFTYYNVNKFKKKFPKKDYTIVEFNPLAKFFWKKLGLVKGQILSGIISLIIILLFIFNFSRDLKLIILGIYIVIMMNHISYFNALKERKEKKKEEWTKFKKIMLIVLLLLSLIDLCLTFNYVHTYKDWQPDRPFRDMEQNPLLLFLWNNSNLLIGTIVSGLIIWGLIYIIVKEAHWVVIFSLLGVLLFGITINIIHIVQLYDLIKLYPFGG